MVIHALDHASEADGQELLNTLRQHATDQRVIRRAVDILDSTGAIDFARGKARDLVIEAWEEIEGQLPQNPASEKLREFGEFLTTRDI